MKVGYKINNQPTLRFCENILVCNFQFINEVMNLPVVKDSSLLQKGHGNTNVGMWKIKKIKND